MATMTMDIGARPEDFVWCQRVAQIHAKNFYYSFWILPKPRRSALCVIYAFCRHCDDIVDQDLCPDEQAKRIAATRTALEDCFQGKAQEPLFRALGAVVREYSISKAVCQDLIRGVEMDLTIRRYSTFEDLRLYCYRVASTVGLMCIEIFGCKTSSGREYAEKLGLILQLTNIARDVREDAARNRIYLPQEETRRFGVREEDISAGRFTPAFAALMKFWDERIDQFERELDGLKLDVNDRRALLAAEIMRVIYAQLRQQMASVGGDVFAHRVHVPVWRKVAAAAKIWWRSRALV